MDPKPPASIVAAIDMSEVSRVALKQAVRLADYADAKLHVVHVVEHDIPEHLLDVKSANSPDRSVREWIRHQATESVDELLRSVEIEKKALQRAGFQSPITPATWSLHPGPEGRDEK